jgi:RNase H-fold protein (predicted Holliday junction resolvase)
MNDKTVLAVDPGTSKCGIAVVRRDENLRIHLLWRAVVPTDQVAQTIKEAHDQYPVHLMIVGGGTNSKAVVHEVRELFPSMGILVVDEKETTLQARERYWLHQGRKGWRKLLPSTMQVPPEPFDDFVAMILAERVLLGSE